MTLSGFNFHWISILPFAIFANLAFAAAGWNPEGADTRFEYQCLPPMRLTGFVKNIDRYKGRDSLNWNLRSIDPALNSRLRFIQISIGAVSPAASFLVPKEQGHYEIETRALTMEPKWLEALRGTDAVDALHPSQQLVMWINEVFHLFVLDGDALARTLPNDRFFPAFNSGAFIFTNEKMAFVISKDLDFLASCPRMNSTWSSGVTGREISAETIGFVENPRVKRFFGCESKLYSRKI